MPLPIAAAAQTALAARAPKVRARGLTDAQRPVMTTMVVTVGVGFLHAWIVKDPLTGKTAATPGRVFIVRMSMMGFILSFMAETMPKVGKSFSYLILAAVLFDRSYDILQSLTGIETPPAKGKAPRPDKPQTVTLLTPAQANKVGETANPFPQREKGLRKAQKKKATTPTRSAPTVRA